VLVKHRHLRSNAHLGDAIGVSIRELGSSRTLKELGPGRDKLHDIAGSSLQDGLRQMTVIPLTTKEQVLAVPEMYVWISDIQSPTERCYANWTSR
jgi:hypothetical protein